MTDYSCYFFNITREVQCSIRISAPSMSDAQAVFHRTVRSLGLLEKDEIYREMVCSGDRDLQDYPLTLFMPSTPKKKAR